MPWLAPGETIEWFWECEKHLLGQVRNVLTAPFEPLGEVPECDRRKPKLPLPSEVVSEGRFLDDEWVYDPTLCGRVVAPHPGALAVRFADHLVAGRGKTLLCLTERRLAAVYVADSENHVLWWQTDRSALRALPEVHLGHDLGQPRYFRAFVFTDGSVLEMDQAVGRGTRISALT